MATRKQNLFGGTLNSHTAGMQQNQSDRRARRRLLRIELLEDRRLLTLDTAQWISVGPDAIIGSGNVDTIAPPVPGGSAFPGAVSGSINVATPRPGDATTIFVGAVNGGIWKTTNAPKELWGGNPGPTWVNLTPDQPSLSITDLEYDLSSFENPRNPTTERLVAGVGTNSSFQRQGGALVGLLFSENGGSDWQVESGNGSLSGRQISAVAPLGTDVLVAMNDIASVNGPGLARITLKGPNNNPFILPSQFNIGAGATLTRTGRVLDLIRDPLSPQTVYVALPEASRVVGSVTTKEGGIFRSTNGGTTWDRISIDIVNNLLDGRAADGSTGPFFTNRVLLSLHHTSVLGVEQNMLYVGIVNTKTIAGLFRFDATQPSIQTAWRKIATPSVTEGKHGDLHFSLVAHPVFPNVVFVGGDVDKTTNKANIVRIVLGPTLGDEVTTRITTATSAPHPDSRGLAFDAVGNLIEVDDGGVYLFDSPSALVLSSGNWLSLNRNLSTFEAVSVAFDPIQLGVVVSTQDNGTAFASAGSTFTQILAGDGVAVKVDQISNSASVVYYSTQNLGVLERRTEAKLPTGSVDLGPERAKLQILNGNLIAGQTRLTVQISDPSKKGFDPTLPFIPAIAINAVRNGNLFVGSKFLYESTNRGDSFRVQGGVVSATSDLIDNDSDGVIDDADEVQPAVPLENNGASSSVITAIAAGGIIDGVADPRLIYVGFQSGEVFVRKGNVTSIVRPGVSLASLSGGGPIVDITIDPRNGHTAYAATPNRIFRTDNDGVAWTDITGSLFIAKPTITSLALVKLPFTNSTLPFQNLDRLFVGTSAGVFSTEVADIHNPVFSFPHIWEKVGVNLPNVRVQDLVFDEASDQLIAATLGRGVFLITNIVGELGTQRIANGDVALVELPGQTIGQLNGSFSITGVDFVQRSGQVIPLVIQRHPLRGDLQLFQQGQLVGEMAFSERFDPATQIPFSQTGQFIFAPNATSNFAFDDAPSNPGLQGVVRFRYVDGTAAKTFSVEVVSQVPTIVDFTKTSTLFQVMSLQQRLNFLGSGDFSGQRLFVDGIVGPLTEQSVRNFKSRPNGDPTLETAVVDAVTSFRLNQVPLEPLTLLPKNQTDILAGFSSLGEQLGLINSLGPIDQPLPLVGSIDPAQIAANPAKEVTIGGTLSPGSIIGNQVIVPLANYLLIDKTPTETEFRDFIQGSPDSNGFSSIVFDIQPTELRVNVAFNKTVTTTKPLDLGSNALAAGLRIGQPPMINLVTELVTSLRIGIDFTKPNLNDAIYVQIENLTTSVHAVSNALLDIQGGFLDLNSTTSNFLLDGIVQVFSVDANSNRARLTLNELIKFPSSSQFATNATGSAAGTIDITTNLFGGNFLGVVAIGEPGNLFSNQPPSIDLSGLAGLRALMDLEPSQVGAAMGQLGTLLQNLRTSDVLGDRIKFTATSKLGDAIDPAKIWNDKVKDLFVEKQGQPAVKTLQELVTRLGSSLNGGSYNTTTKLLSFNFKLAGDTPAKKVRLGFSDGLGDLKDVATQSDGDLSGSADLTFTLAFDLSQTVGGGVTFTNATTLASLNGGRGVMGLAADGLTDLRIGLSNGVSFEVALDGATTLGEIVTRIRAAVPIAIGTAGFEVRIERDHLRLVDKMHGDANAFSIKGANGSLAGLAGIGLGIVATIDKPNAMGEFVLDGSPLHGDTLSNHAFLVASGANVPKISGTINLVATDIDASAKLNLVPVTLGNGATITPAGSGTSHQTFSTTFKDPNNDGRLTFAELRNGLANVNTIANPSVIGGTSNFSLPASGVLPWGTVASNPGVTITWTDLANPNTISIDYGPQLAQLRDFGAIDKNAITALLDQVAMYLAQIEAVSFLRDNIPLLDKNLGSLVNAAEKFRNAMNDFGDDVIDSLVSLEERLETAVEKALGIPVTPGDGSTVELMPDNTPGSRALRVEIDYNPTYTKQHKLNLDLDSLGVPAIGNLVDARGTAMFSVTAGANVNLDVGLDLTNPTNPRPFLYNTTTAALGAKIYGSGIHFKAALGPLGIAIGNDGNNNGFLVLDSDGLLEPNARRTELWSRS